MLSGEVALVTGASRGIGKAIALELAQQGASVAINFRDKMDAGTQVANEILDKGGKAILVQGDVSRGQGAQSVVDAVVQQLGTIDILVNNAGITQDKLLLRMEEDDWQKVLSVNLGGTFNCCKAAAKVMLKARKGRIINISSVVGLRGNAGQANYAAAKAGVVGLTKSLSKEFGSRGITVNCIAPGYIDTDMTRVLPEKQRSKIISAISLGRMGTPEDIAPMVAFLAGKTASYITGQVISVDGGMAI